MKTNYFKNKSNTKKVSKVNNINYRGMTLKEYFQISEVGTHVLPHEIRETEEENSCSSKEVATPCFNQGKRSSKIKTENSEGKKPMREKPIFSDLSKNPPIFSLENKTKLLRAEKTTKEQCPNLNTKTIRTKRSFTLASSDKDHLNRSTVTSFYQLESKRKKMLEKLKQEKLRCHQLQLSDAFFITKYDGKFRKNTEKNQ